MSHPAPRRVRLSQQDRCFRVITGGANDGNPAAPAAEALAKFGQGANAFQNGNTSPKASAPPRLRVNPPQRRLMTPEALFMLGWGLGLATGLLVAAFIVRAGVFA